MYFWRDFLAYWLDSSIHCAAAVVYGVFSQFFSSSLRWFEIFISLFAFTETRFTETVRPSSGLRINGSRPTSGRVRPNSSWNRPTSGRVQRSSSSNPSYSSRNRPPSRSSSTMQDRPDTASRPDSSLTRPESIRSGMMIVISQIRYFNRCEWLWCPFRHRRMVLCHFRSFLNGALNVNSVFSTGVLRCATSLKH